MRTFRRALAPLALAALALGACQNDPATAPAAAHPDDAHGGAPPSAAAPYTDARFLAEMTAHHRMALDMTRMAAAMDAGPDVKRMAAAMEAAQTREIAEMTALLRATGAPADPTAAAGMDHGDMGMPLSMDELHAARPFDRAFLVAMIGHHAAAVTMAAEAVARSTNADVQRLARTIIRDQAREIGEMQALLDAEYPGPPTAAAPAGGAPADSTAR